MYPILQAATEPTIISNSLNQVYSRELGVRGCEMTLNSDNLYCCYRQTTVAGNWPIGVS